MPLEKLTVDKGKTIQNSNGDPIKIRYALEIDVLGQDEEQVQVTRRKAETIIDGWLAIYQTQRGAIINNSTAIPDLDEADLLELPFWKGKRATGHLAAKNEGGWIGVDPKYLKDDLHKQLLSKLDQAIRRAKGTLEFGMFTYKYSGARSQYITRTPTKQESAT